MYEGHVKSTQMMWGESSESDTKDFDAANFDGEGW